MSAGSEVHNLADGALGHAERGNGIGTGEIAVGAVLLSEVSHEDGVRFLGRNEIGKVAAKKRKRNRGGAAGSWGKTGDGVDILDGGSAHEGNGKTAVITGGVERDGTGGRVLARNHDAGDHDRIAYQGIDERRTECHGDQRSSFADVHDGGGLSGADVGQSIDGWQTEAGGDGTIAGRAEGCDEVGLAGVEAAGAGDKHARIVRQNRGMGGIDAHVSFADVGVTGNIDLQRRAGVIGCIGAERKYLVEIRRIRRSGADGNDHRTIDLATGKFEQRGHCNGGHPAHTSETHRHPEGEVLVCMYVGQNWLL